MSHAACPSQDGADDFALVPLLWPDSFGFAHDDILAWACGREQIGADAIRACRHLLEGGKAGKMPLSAQRKAALRLLSVRFAVCKGWSHIKYDPCAASLLTRQQDILGTIMAAGSLFPLATVDEVTLRLADGRVAMHGTSIRFDRQDYPGFMGVFAGLQHFATTGIAPEQNWLHVHLAPCDAYLLTQRGLAARQGRTVRTGSLAEVGMFTIDCVNRERAAAAGAGGVTYRFPARVADTLGLGRGGDDGVVLMSRVPYTIPLQHLQRFYMGCWRTL